MCRGVLDSSSDSRYLGTRRGIGHQGAPKRCRV